MLCCEKKFVDFIRDRTHSPLIDSKGAGDAKGANIMSNNIFGFVVAVRGENIRPATAAELRKSLVLDLRNENYGGAWTDSDGQAVYVSGETAEGRAIALGCAERTVASWPVARVVRAGLARHVGVEVA